MKDYFSSIIDCISDEIILRAPYLIEQLHRVKWFSESGTITPRTDGVSCYIDPSALRDLFLKSDHVLSFGMLHMLSHILMGHVSTNDKSDPLAFHLAFDISAARFVASVDRSFLPASMQAALAALERYSAPFAEPDRIAEAIRSAFPDDEQLVSFQRIISFDDHADWSKHAGELSIRITNPPIGANCSPFARHNSSSSGKNALDAREKLDIKLTDDSYNSFASHLRQFSQIGETPRPDQSSIQIPLYLYSLSQLDAALIEENEYTEEYKIYSFVIAIDTSGSCARDLTHRFLQITRDILMKEHLFFDRFALHILQCDDRIRSDVRITSPREFRAYIENLSIYGGGGTDFRPIFDRVDELIALGRLPGLRGILCFSDGKGIFPNVKPHYKVTFAFPENDHDLIDVPSWVDRVIF